MSTNWAIRSRCDDIVTTTLGLEPICIAHPDYPYLVLLIMFPCDTKGDNVYGVLLEVVLDACRIIANNQPAFLSTSKSRNGRVSEPPGTDILLSCAIYYYFLGKCFLPIST